MCGSGGLIAKPCLTLETPHGLWPPRRLCPWDLQSRILEMDCDFLLQGIFPTQRWKSGLLHCRHSLLTEL